MPPNPLLCSREIVASLEPSPPPRIPGSPGNYKFLLGQILFQRHATSIPFAGEIRNLPEHIVSTVIDVFHSVDVTLYYTIAVSRRRPSIPSAEETTPVITHADLLALLEPLGSNEVRDL